MRSLAVLSRDRRYPDPGVGSLCGGRQQSTLSRALDALEADGLVKCEADSSDGRARRVFIADAGRAAFDRLWPHMSETYESMFVGIDPEERRAFVGTLQKMLSNTRKHDF